MSASHFLRSGLAAALGTVLGASFIPTASAQSVTTTPVGAVTLDALANSDVVVSIPLRRPSVYSGAASSITNNVVNALGTPWVDSQFVYASGTQPNRYYLLFTSGVREGMYYTISSNTSSSLTLDLAEDSLSSLTGTESFSIIPFWTFGTLFPDGTGVSGTSVHSSRQTELLIPRSSAAGINLSAEYVYYYFTGTNPGWRRVGGGLSTLRNDDVIVPDSYFIYRQNNSTSNTHVFTGTVPATNSMTIVGTIASNTRQDNAVSLGYPIALTLAQTKLFESGGFEASSSHAARADELLVFDNSVVGKNKSAAQVYYYFSGASPGWRRVGGGLSTVRDNDLVIQPGQGFIVRKAAKSTPGTALITTDLPYSLN